MVESLAAAGLLWRWIFPFAHFGLAAFDRAGETDGESDRDGEPVPPETEKRARIQNSTGTSEMALHGRGGALEDPSLLPAGAPLVVAAAQWDCALSWQRLPANARSDRLQIVGATSAANDAARAAIRKRLIDAWDPRRVLWCEEVEP
jgi:hypothetical protein